jgi:hypothetical protein
MGGCLGASGGVHRTPGASLRECPPAFGLLLDFAAGSTRCSVHGGGCEVGCSTAVGPPLSFARGGRRTSRNSKGWCWLQSTLA